MRQLVVATRNAHKLREIGEILSGTEVQLVSIEQVAPHLADLEVVEDCTTLEGNALKKAFTLSYHLQAAVMADDSGFFVEALGGEPGLRSARYLGEQASQHQRNESILQRLAAQPGSGRRAWFACVIAVVDVSRGLLRTFEGRVEGEVAPRQQGEGGFGYDPIFLPEGDSRSFAEMSPSEKHQVSHRSRALAAMRAGLELE